MRTIVKAAAAVALLAGAASAQCAPDRAEIRGDFGTARFRVMIADDDAERAQGLMFVPEMPRMAGMLFLYERPQPVSFWMMNTLIPLDMLFIDQTGTIQRIHREAIPQDTTSIPGGDNVLAVLEINGGMAETLGIAVGDELRHPQMPQDVAAWPCEPSGAAAAPDGAASEPAAPAAPDAAAAPSNG